MLSRSPRRPTSPRSRCCSKPSGTSAYADLTILGQLDPDRGPAQTIQPRPEQVALASGRPVIVVPYAGKFETVGRCAGRLECEPEGDPCGQRRDAAAGGSRGGDRAGDRPARGPERAWPGSGRRHLAALGAPRRQSHNQQIVSADIPTEEVLLSRAAALAADLLVTGAYGHYRVRELLLGGATRSILRSMTLAVLISH